MGICLLGGGKRNCDTHSISCSGNLRKLENSSLFISTPASCRLPGNSVSGYCVQHNQLMRQMEGCAVSLQQRAQLEGVWCGCAPGRSRSRCPTQARQGQSSARGRPCPLQEGTKGFVCPSLLSRKSSEFVFALAKCVPKTMQGHFSSAYSVYVWVCLNVEKKK